MFQRSPKLMSTYRLAQVVQGLDRSQLQLQLLLDPTRFDLWGLLKYSGGQPHRKAPLPPSPPAAVSTSTTKDGTPMPWIQRFHPLGTAEADAVMENQFQEYQALVDAGEYDLLLRRLDQSTARLFAHKLEPSQAYRLGHRAYELQHYSIADCLIGSAAAAGEAAGDLLPWALLFDGLSLCGLGKLRSAQTLLEELLTHTQQSSGISQGWSQAGLHGRVSLAWIYLNRGARVEAADLLKQLREASQVDSVMADVDLLGRVLSTLDWLDSNPRDQLSNGVDRADSCGLAAALDSVQMSPCGGLITIRGWLVDTCGQIKELCLVRGNRVWRMDLGQARYSYRSDLSELISRCGGCADLHAGLELKLASMPEERSPHQPGEAAELFVVLANGDQLCMRQSIQVAALNVNQFKELLEVCLQAPCRLVSANLLNRTREIWSETLNRKLEITAEHHQFGVLPDQPEVSVVVPLYGRVDFMEYQLNWFNAWRRRRGASASVVQLIYVLDDPRMKGECLALAKRCNTLYSMPFELVLNPDNLGFAGANNRGAAYAKAPLLLLLNSDVLPASDYSLEMLILTMQQQPQDIGALGARLLFENGAIQHQGMSFEQAPDLDGELAHVWLNDHPLKGVKIPVPDLLGQSLEEVEAATAACLLLHRHRFEQLGGLDSHYIVGDFEDSDLCMQLRSLGLPILVDQAACFYHLERQSVDLASESNALRMKLVAANAITHHQRWCSAIERLQASEI